MIRWQKTRGIGGLLVLLLLAWAIADGRATRSVQAQELKDLDISLKWVPADAAFYSVLLRSREQLEIVRDSKAWARLMEMPAVKEGLKRLEETAANDPDSPPAKVQVALNNPAVQEVLALLGDMFSQDAFVYGKESVVDFLELTATLNGAQRTTRFIEKINPSSEVTEQQAQVQLLFRVLADCSELIRTPELIAGFRVENTDRARSQLDTLLGLVTLASMSVPELQGCCQRTTVAGHDYVTITLKGEQIPWEEVALDRFRAIEIEEGDVDKVVEKLRALTLVIAVGLRDDYLLVSIGDSTENLAQLGTGPLLLDRPELKPLAEFADRPLTSISYVSEEMNVRLSMSPEDIDDLTSLVDVFLPHEDISPEQEAQIRKDVAALAEDLKRLLPEPGATLAFSFLTDDGMESYSYNGGKGFGLAGDKPLALLKHLGGAPLAALVARGENQGEGYELLARWLKVGFRYFDEYAVREMGPRQRKEYREFVKRFRPLVKQVDRVTREKLLPALGDEGGVVLDAVLELRQITKDVPALDRPVPIPELALVLAIKDEYLFRDALEEYRQIAGQLIGELRELNPDEVPAITVPEAEMEPAEAGTIYFLPPPEEAGVAKEIVPSVGLSETVAVFSFSRAQIRRLLKPTPLEAGGALADVERPKAAAFVLRWSALVERATPWVELLARAIIKEERLPDEQAEEIMEQVHTVLDVLQVLRTVTSEYYFKDGMLVTHQVAVFGDVP